VVADRSARHEEAKTPLIKVPLVIPRRKALALFAAGSRYITNFDADSAWQAAPAVGGIVSSFAPGSTSRLKFSASHVNIVFARSASLNGNHMETLLTKAQKLIAFSLGVLLVVVVALSTLHLGYLIALDIWKPPRFIIPVQDLLEIFSFFLLILIGLELLETLKAYLKKDVVHVRLVIEVALIAIARKIIIVEPATVPAATMFGVAAVVLALAVAFYLERQASKD